MRKKHTAKLTSFTNRKSRRVSGQALVEYVLISAIIVLALIVALTLAGPAIGNVFSNTIYNALSRTTTPYSTFSAADYNIMSTRLASYTPATFPFKTNTPAGPTCAPGKWVTVQPTTDPPTYLTNC